MSIALGRIPIALNDRNFVAGAGLCKRRCRRVHHALLMSGGRAVSAVEAHVASQHEVEPHGQVVACRRVCDGR